MGIDWELLKKVLVVYERNGGKTDERMSEFMDGKLAVFYDDFCEKVGERCMALLRTYLTRGIEGRNDLKAMSSIFTYLIDLTESPFSATEFKGEKNVRKILLEGDEITMARKYDNGWYIKSVESVVASIERNATYLDSIKDGLNAGKQADAAALLEKYEKLRDRVLGLKDACPESQLTIVEGLKKIQTLVKQDRRKLLIKDFYSNLHATTDENIFLRSDKILGGAESILVNPPKGATIPNDNQIIGSMILPEKSHDIDQIIHIQEYRDQCLELFKSIEDEITEREVSVAKLEVGVDEAEKKGRELSMARTELKRKFENGLLTKMQLEREGTKLKMQLDSAYSVYQRKKIYYDAMSSKFLHLYQAWQGIAASLEIIVKNDSEDTKLIEHFDKIVEALRRFSGFIKGIEGEDGENFDFSLYQELVQKVQSELKREIEEVVTITGVEVNPLDPLVRVQEGIGTSFVFDDANDPFAVPAVTETLRPTQDAPVDAAERAQADPGAVIEGDPADNENPFNAILGNRDEE